ncbi:hypothetical protein HNR38_001949 [Marinobacter oulmenensis]|uniref:Uncharacterized protein n=1 Tax=Marinobacter oulmenensis TaxID=643747 RepID=A0A840UDK6_9GAMM|nr:hypothetical protein [Marinobacter oulmenensis]
MEQEVIEGLKIAVVATGLIALAGLSLLLGA